MAIIGLLVISYWLLGKYKQIELKTNQPETKMSRSLQKKTRETEALRDNKAIFIPYWSIENHHNQPQDFDRLLYFGVTVNEDGVDKNEAGYQSLDRFLNLPNNDKEKYLIVRMTDNELSLAILSQPRSTWGKIWLDVINIAKEKEFVGIILDLELSQTLSTERTILLSNQFIEDFAQQMRAARLIPAIALYGDIFYRKRPYNVTTIGQSVDEVMIMAYDFHKSRGEAGPNFPLSGKDIYGYDLQTMLADFRQAVPPEKITVIFGMFGYDWTVDEKKRPIMPAKSLTLNQITSQFIDQCQWQDCVVKRDKLSQETEVNYVYSQVKDNYGLMDFHIVWFEDKQSVEAKSAWLKQQGINSFAYWAWGYY